MISSARLENDAVAATTALARVLEAHVGALLAAAMLAWARALGEFGATLMVAGNVPGVTRTLPLAVYTALDRSLEEARAASWVLLGVALVAMVVAERWGRR